MADKDRVRVEPIIISTDEGQEFTLDFNRNTVMYAEQHGFTVDSLQGSQYMTGVSNLFFYAFRMHHPYMTKVQTDEILFDEMGGMPEGMIERLGELYAQPYNALIQTEEARKNSKWAIRM